MPFVLIDAFGFDLSQVRAAELDQMRDDLAQARATAWEAQAESNDLRIRLEAAERALREALDVAEQALREAQDAGKARRQVLDARQQARGRWARLRAAWRGE